MKPPQATWLGRKWLKWQQRRCPHRHIVERDFMINDQHGACVMHIVRCRRCGKPGPYYQPLPFGGVSAVGLLNRAKELPLGSRIEA